MAIDPAAGSYFERNANFPTYNDLSVCFWVKPLSLAADQTLYVQGSAGDAARDIVSLLTSGILMIWANGTIEYGSTVLTVGTWYHVAFTREGNTRTVYLNGVSEIVNSASTTYTKANEKLGGTYGATLGNSRYAAAKMWSGGTQLTASEFIDEMYGYAAVRATNLHTVTYLEDASDLDNQTGGEDWIFYGTIGSAADEPPFLVDEGDKEIAISTTTIANDDLSLTGTFAPSSGSIGVQVTLLQGGVGVSTLDAQKADPNWSVTFSNVAPGTYTPRARVYDSFGQVFVDGSAVTFDGLSGSDEIPYLYETTGLLASPASLTLPTGTTATVRAVNQAGTPVPGAIVAMSNGNATAPALTDADGYVVVTGVTNGATTMTLSAVIQNGSTATATVPVTISGATGPAITVTPATATLSINQTQQFTATNPGGGGETWSVQSGGGSINSTGLYTAPATPTTAVIRGARTSSLTDFDESTITVLEAQSSIGGGFLGAGDQSVSPGGNLEWRILVQVNGQAAQGAVVTAVASDPSLITLGEALATAADGTTTITGVVPQIVETGRVVTIAFNVVSGLLTFTLSAVVSIIDAPYGYVQLRGVRYPRPYPQNT